MKSFFVSAASAVALVAAFSGSASAQLANIDLDAVLALPGTVVGGVAGIDVIPEGFVDALLPVDATLIAGNTAVVVSPVSSAVQQVAVPLDVTGFLGAGLAAGVGTTPNTTSLAAAIGALDIDTIGGTNVLGDTSQTVVGQVIDQVSQSALVSATAAGNATTLAVGPGTLFAIDEASEAAAAVGTSSSNSAARFATLAVTTPTVALTENAFANTVTSAVEGIYQGNIALVVAPVTSIATQVGVANIAGDMAQTSVGQVITQVSSVGLDATGVVAAIKGTD